MHPLQSHSHQRVPFRFSNVVSSARKQAVSSCAIYALIGGIVVTTPLPAVAQTHKYALQVGAISTRSDANQLVEELRQGGYPEVEILQLQGQHKVFVGSFSTHLDAVVAKNSATTDLLTLAPFIRVVPGAAIDCQGIPPGPFRRFFPPEPMTKQPPLAALRSRKDYQELSKLDVTGSLDAFRKALLDQRREIATGDPLAGYIELNLGIQQLTAGNYDEALKHFWSIAHGHVTATRSHYEMALRRIAWITHKKRDRLEAYKAYSELQARAQMEPIRATCMVERAGLAMELAESAKGTHAELRDLISTVTAQIPKHYRKEHALLELMHLESFARQPARDYRRAAQLGEEFIVRHTDPESTVPEREMAAAVFQTAHFQRLAGNQNRALQLYETVLTRYPVHVESFAGHHPHSEALIGLAHIARQVGDEVQKDRIRALILEHFPDEEIAKQIRQNPPPE